MNPDKMAKLLTELRKEKGLTQQQAAEIAFVSRESVSKWERGINTPDAQSLLILSKLYNITANEILYGERETNENKEEIANTTISILNYNAKKISRLTRIFVTIIILLSSIFLTIYFVNNYNSIKLYVISGEGENFAITSGLILTSPEKNYIQLGEVVKPNDDITIENIIFYYKYKDKIINIANDTNTKMLLIDLNNIPEIKAINDMKHVYNNLYMDIYTSEYKETIKFNTREDYSNNKIVHQEIKENVNSKKSSLKESFEIDYSKFKEKNGKLIYKTDNFTYEYDEEMEIIYIKHDDEKYSYFINTNQIEFAKNVFFDFYSVTCTRGNCDEYNTELRTIISELFL